MTSSKFDVLNFFLDACQTSGQSKTPSRFLPFITTVELLYTVSVIQVPVWSPSAESAALAERIHHTYFKNAYIYTLPFIHSFLCALVFSMLI